MSAKDPTHFLSEMQGTAVDPGLLESLGKEAASLADGCNMGLNEAVVRTIGKTKLNSEQVRRVVEFANQEAFHQKYSSMDPSNRVVDIDGGPADPAQVLQDLNDGARPEATAMDSIEYLMPPESKKAASLDFGLGEIKEESTSKQRTLQDVEHLRIKLNAALDQVVGEAESSKFQMQEAARRLSSEVRTAVKTAGLCQEDLQQAWSREDPEMVNTALGMLGTLPRRNHKVAHRVNPQHPVVTLYKEFSKHAHDYGTQETARRGLETQLVKVEEFLRRQLI